MKNQIILFIATGLLIMFFQSFRLDSTSEKDFPEEISLILKTSCYNCHYTGAQAEKALKAVDFAQYDTYRVTKKIAVLDDICKMVEEEKMPPEKYLERNPDHQISEANKKLLCDWTRKEADKLLQGN